MAFEDPTPGHVRLLLACGAAAHLTKRLAIPDVPAASDRVLQAHPRPATE